MEIDLKQLRDLMKAIRQFDLSEIEIEKNGERIALRRTHAGGDAPAYVSIAPPAAPPSMPAAAGALSVAPAAPLDDASVAYITSPFVGTFYRSPSPDSAPFVDVGQRIKPKQVLCIVEAMKLMNEIEADFAGTILDVLVENGKAVEFGERLFKVSKA